MNDYAELDRELENLKADLAAQDEQLKAIQDAEAQFETDGDTEKLIQFWEGIWNSDGLLFNGSKWTFRLPDLYISEKRYDDALRILNMIKDPVHQDRKESYIKKIEKKRK